jgi:CheY-like chemotaxis protein
MTPVRAVIVDDDETEAGALADLLRAGGDDLEVVLQAPLSSVEATAASTLEALGEQGARLVLVDYRLGDNPIEGGDIVRFKGGAVAGYIRDQNPEVPIALLTSEEKLHDWVERRTGIKEIFDWTLIKKEISAEGGAERARARIVDYARSWEAASTWGEEDALWERMAELLNAPEGEIALFEELEAEPPRAEVTAEVMHWVLFDALLTPGPLIDSDTARVVLGLDHDSFGRKGVSEWLADARYDGALNTFAERWWGSLVRAKLAEAAAGTRPLDASARASALGAKLGVELRHEGCSWCRGERTLQACHQCGKATDAAHSVRPLSRPLPAWADSWVICYSCIADGSAEEITFPQSAHDVVLALTEGRIQPPDE